MTEVQIEKIHNRELCIFASVFLDSKAQQKLFEVLDKIVPGGRKEYLKTRDRWYQYCNQRNVWYGTQWFPDMPYIQMNELL